MRILVLLCCCAVVWAQAPRALSPSDALALRKALSSALVAGGPEARAALGKLAADSERRASTAAVMTALREGPHWSEQAQSPRGKGNQAQTFQDFGAVRTGYRFAVGSRSIGYAVDRPKALDSGRRLPLLIDPGHGSGAALDAEGKAGFLPFFRSMAEEAEGGADWIIVRTELIEQFGVGGQAEALPEDELAAAFDLLLRDVASRFPVDLDRVYVAGLSQSGFWAWYLGRANPSRFAGIAPMGAVTWQVDGYEPNFLHLPIRILHGTEDQVCPIAQPRASLSRLRELGANAELNEVLGAGHDGQVWSQLGAALAELSKTPRVRAPRRILKQMQTLHCPLAYWVRIDALEQQGDGRARTKPTAALEAVAEGQEITLTTKGVRSLTLALSSELLDLDRPVTVTWNGRKVHQGKPKRSARDAALFALDHLAWPSAPEALIPLR